MSDPKSLPQGLSVVVCSAGGVGSTMLINAVSNYRTTNCLHDFDGLKHLAIPPLTHDPDVRFVYVFGDPILAAMSLFRRRFHHAQSTKLLALSDPQDVIDVDTTLEDYAASGSDRFQFRTHFHNWYHAVLDRPTLFVRYETMHDHVHQIADFLKLPEQFISDFPKRCPRQSRLEDLSPAALEGLRKMYGAFIAELQTVPDVELRSPVAV